MTSWIEFGTQALQALYQTVVSSHRPQPETLPQPETRPQPFSAAAELGLAAAQNLWLQGLKLTMLPADRAIALGSQNLGTLGQWPSAHAASAASLVDIPLLGPGRELGQTLLQIWDAWVQLYPATAAYQGVLLEIQRRSFAAFLDELIALTGQGQPLTSPAQLQQLWSQVADRVFEQTLCSPDAMRARGTFVNAMNRYKLSQQTLTERYLTALNLPTRREVDDIHKALYDLRREMKHLKKALPEKAA